MPLYHFPPCPTRRSLLSEDIPQPLNTFFPSFSFLVRMLLTGLFYSTFFISTFISYRIKWLKTRIIFSTNLRFRLSSAWRFHAGLTAGNLCSCTHAGTQLKLVGPEWLHSHAQWFLGAVGWEIQFISKWLLIAATSKAARASVMFVEDPLAKEVIEPN